MALNNPAPLSCQNIVSFDANKTPNITVVSGCNIGCRFCKCLVIKLICGKTGIRTLGTRKGTTVFETAPIDHSGTFPLVEQRFCALRLQIYDKISFPQNFPAKILLPVANFDATQSFALSGRGGGRLRSMARCRRRGCRPGQGHRGA